jgi:hypothetical protein
MKKNRWFKSKILIASQYWNDIDLQARKQIDYVLLYRGLAKSLNKLQEIYRNCDLDVPFEMFLELYRYATAKKHHFLYINVVDSTFRKYFTHELHVPNDDDDEEPEREL